MFSLKDLKYSTEIVICGTSAQSGSLLQYREMFTHEPQASAEYISSAAMTPGENDLHIIFCLQLV